MGKCGATFLSYYHNYLIRALQRRWVEDAKRDNDAFDMRKQNEENVMLRKMYRGLLSKMHEWSADEQNELRYGIDSSS